MKRIHVLLIGFAVLFAAYSSAAHAKSTVETIRDRGFVFCGVTDRMPGFATQSTDGTWQGFNVDYCRALAAAVFDDPEAYRAIDYWLDALVAKEVDVLHAGSTWTLSRDNAERVDFPGTYFYDGQGFIAHASLGFRTLKEAMAVKGLKVCAIGSSSTAMPNLMDFMAKNKVTWEVVAVRTMDGMWRAFFGGRCNMAIHDRTALAGVHAARLKDSEDYVVFPEVISKEPLSPAVREDDPVWRNLVAWVTFVTIAAEELGVTSKNVDDLRANSTLPEVRRLLGVDPGLGDGLPVDDAWAYRVIKHIGNYGEIFERNLGRGSPFKMSRGLNALWTDGGLLYAPPIR